MIFKIYTFQCEVNKFLYGLGKRHQQYIMCNRLCVVELWRYSRQKSAISSTRPIWRTSSSTCSLLRSSWNFTSKYALWREVNWQSFKITSSLCTELWRLKLSEMASKFDEITSPSKKDIALKHWKKSCKSKTSPDFIRVNPYPRFY